MSPFRKIEYKIINIYGVQYIEYLYLVYLETYMDNPDTIPHILSAELHTNDQHHSPPLPPRVDAVVCIGDIGDIDYDKDIEYGNTIVNDSVSNGGSFYDTGDIDDIRVIDSPRTFHKVEHEHEQSDKCNGVSAATRRALIDKCNGERSEANANTESTSNNGFNTIPIDQFLRFKAVNTEIPGELLSFATNMNYKIRGTKPKGNPWRRVEPGPPKKNWLLAKKINQDDNEKLYSQFRGILNKISVGNFNTLAIELINLEITQKDHLFMLVDNIFKKALVEQRFSQTYAKLCVELSSYYINTQEGDKVHFRELLLNKCQLMFEEAISLDKTSPTSENFSAKEHVLNCMAFIGELYNNKLLTNKIVYSCLSILLLKVDMDKAYTVDSICIFLKTVGSLFCSSYKDEATTYFLKLAKVKESKSIDIKEKFTIMDLFDMKSKNGW